MAWPRRSAEDAEQGEGVTTAKTPTVDATLEPDLLAEVKAVADHLRELEARLNRRSNGLAGRSTAEPGVAPAAEMPRARDLSDELQAERDAEDASQRVQRIISAAEATAAEIRARAEADGARIRDAAHADGRRLFEAIEALRPATLELEHALDRVLSALGEILDFDPRG